MKKISLVNLLMLFCLFSEILLAQEITNNNEQTENNTQTTDYSKLFNPKKGKAYFVSSGMGNDKFPGTKEKPILTIKKAISLADADDIIIVSEGNYLNTNSSIISTKPLKMYGSFDETFTERDITLYASIFEPTNVDSEEMGKPIIQFTEKIDGTIINGFVFDVGQKNKYSKEEGKYPGGGDEGALIISDKGTAPIIEFTNATQEGKIDICNNVFLNGSEGALRITHKAGRINIMNNVFVSNRNVAIEILPSCKKQKHPNEEFSCFDCFVHNNTILFTWAEKPNDKNTGYGLRISGNINYFITSNIFGTNVSCGIDNSKVHNNELLRFDNNTFFCNKKGDMHYLKKDMKRVFYSTHEFEDVVFRSVFSNVHEVPSGIKLNVDYMNGFLNTVFNSPEDYVFNSLPNIWREESGQDRIMQTMKESLKMYGNKYPQDDALQLFGNVDKRGVQVFE